MFKKLVCALAVLMLLSPTVLAKPREVLPPVWPSLQAVVELGNDDSSGSGCVTSLGIFTAGHVAKLPDLMWSQDGEKWHRTAISFLNEEMDLARLHGEGTLPPPAPLATHSPRNGEEVAVLGFMGEMRPLFHLRVLGMWNGELLLDGMGFPGTSGSCVLSERGEVYGVVLGSRYWDAATRSVVRAAPLWSGH